MIQDINPYTGLPLTDRQKDVLGKIFLMAFGEEFYYKKINKIPLTPSKSSVKVKE